VSVESSARPVANGRAETRPVMKATITCRCGPTGSVRHTAGRTFPPARSSNGNGTSTTLCFVMERLPISQRIDVFLGIAQGFENRITGRRVQPLRFIRSLAERAHDYDAYAHGTRNGKHTVQLKLLMLVNRPGHFYSSHRPLHCSVPFLVECETILAARARLHRIVLFCLQCHDEATVSRARPPRPNSCAGSPRAASAGWPSARRRGLTRRRPRDAAPPGRPAPPSSPRGTRPAPHRRSPPCERHREALYPARATRSRVRQMGPFAPSEMRRQWHRLSRGLAARTMPRCVLGLGPVRKHSSSRSGFMRNAV